ncbi:PepSY domain-containing protein [Brevundimonas sp. A19_0]|uniref:PepSY-associated TM helix domain-containing protein n=1 Tax=Brevundimonas sp. A19_0 TaxID=2821087 RepID=UPI001ADD4A9F|nr:PepSY domain-containing protein [Brevundimonas sp. A19_0]MBO9500523.1 PepSY domain-containing protein [Brevundimonas sp. A19_0]
MSKVTQPLQDGPALSNSWRRVWRWHFFAGLIVMPVLMLMALTGGLYLYKTEIEGLAWRSMAVVEARDTRASADLWQQGAEQAADGTALAVVVPDRPDRAVQVRVRGDRGERTVFVDPYDGRVTGMVGGQGIMELVKKLHSLELLGKPFNILVEVVAGWAIILVATGLFLWWPRKGRNVAVALPRAGDPARRPFWRDAHAVTGLYVGGIILFLALTGMPWSAVWGDRFMNVMRESGLGRPPAPAAASPWSHGKGHNAPSGTGWTMEHAVLHTPTGGPGMLSRVIATAEAEDARSLYVEGTTGQVVADLRWEQFGGGAKAFEWGIAVHQGMQYGEINRLIMLLGCIGIWVLGISGGLMVWKRRPRGRGITPPPAPPDARGRAAVLGIVLPLAVIFPLTGLSLAVALGAEWLWGRMRR